VRNPLPANPLILMIRQSQSTLTYDHSAAWPQPNDTYQCSKPGGPGNLPGCEAQDGCLLPSARATSCPCHPWLILVLPRRNWWLVSQRGENIYRCCSSWRVPSSSSLHSNKPESIPAEFSNNSVKSLIARRTFFRILVREPLVHQADHTSRELSLFGGPDHRTQESGNIRSAAIRRGKIGHNGFITAAAWRVSLRDGSKQPESR
jgi:hypothetical protein